MALDTSIPLQAQAPQGGIGNFLAPALQLFQLKNMQNQQMQFQQQFAARQAIGPILQQSIDPNTGEPDYGKAAILASQNPQAAWMTGDLLNQGVQRKQTQALTLKTEIENQVARTQQNAGIATSLLSQRTQINRPDGTPGYGLDPALVTKTITDEIANGQIPKDLGTQFLQNLPQDPEGLHNRVLQVAQNLNAHNDQLQSILGKIEPINTGNAIQLTQQSPGGVNPITAIGAKIPLKPTPGESLQTVKTLTGYDEKGNPIFGEVPRTSFVGGQGNNNPASVNPLINGANPNPVTTNPNKLPIQSEPTAGQVATGEQQKESAQGGQKILNDLNAAAQEIPQLQTSIKYLQDLKQSFQPGGGAQVYEKTAKIMQALGFPQSSVDKMANGSLPSMQAFQAELTPFLASDLKRQSNGLRVFSPEMARTLESLDISADPGAFDRSLALVNAQMNKVKDMSQEGVNFKQALHRGDPSVQGLDVGDFIPYYNKNHPEPSSIPEAQPKQYHYDAQGNRVQ